MSTTGNPPVQAVETSDEAGAKPSPSPADLPPSATTDTGDAHPLSSPVPANQASTTTTTNDEASSDNPPATPDLSRITSETDSLTITLLMISGTRCQIKINSDYMAKHALKLEDPFDLSVLTLKECIWKDWRDDWDQRPPSAHFIRLIHFGRLLDDRHPLRDCRLNKDTPNVVHMTIRPSDTGEDDATQRSAKLTFGQSRSTRDRSSPSCRCVIL
ncbi:hypothetical protein BJ508DRAFT_86546 [Ascobolus immersus RN42]|uniref:UBL3-like ubiquitin domain-containing protein n=1 Tax=Ascobolus immersus RN42 TaxID=1160509 RepID=A0A3N4I957_ASCIM|nr:hypothetical protein BJ508DRAFT_86546 [Ascobolus immersus RN42]